MLFHSFNIAAHWLHLLGAVILIGGLVFYLVVIPPTLRNIAPAEARKFAELAGVRFRAIAIILLAILLLTGLYLIQQILQAVDGREEFFSSFYGRMLGLKMAASTLVIALAAWLAFGPVPGMVSALETRDEIRSRALARLTLYFSAFILLLSLMATLCIAFIRASA